MTEGRLSGPIASLDAPFRVVAAPAPRMFYLRQGQWTIITYVAGAAAFAMISLYENDSLWLGIGLFAAFAVAMHTFMLARVVPWIPGMVAVVAFIQWVIAPWVAYYVPPDASVFEMTQTAPEYFAYAVPVTVLFVLGMYLPMWRIGRAMPERRVMKEPTSFRFTCDAMIGIGTIGYALMFRVPSTYRYTMELTTYLAFVGTYGLMLVNARGWVWRLVFVLALRMALSTGSGLFHEFMLWLAYSTALWVYARQVPSRTVFVLLLVGGFFVGVLDEAKVVFRRQIAIDPEMSVTERFAVLGSTVGSQAETPVETFTGAALSHFVTRLNQGWIIARVMYWVPVQEPYANGETLINAFRAALIPRALDPGKYEAGGGAYFERFTGFTLYNTSMNLSVAGEMYANFGYFGGILGTFCFGFGIGLIYRQFAVAAQRSALWWAWAPYVLLYAMMAENGIGEGINQIAKSALVMIAVISFTPGWQNLLLKRRA